MIKNNNLMLSFYNDAANKIFVEWNSTVSRIKFNNHQNTRLCAKIVFENRIKWLERRFSENKIILLYINWIKFEIHTRDVGRVVFLTEIGLCFVNFLTTVAEINRQK